MTVHGFAVSGKAGSGKTRFANALAAALDEEGVPSLLAPFAEALKAEVYELWGITKEMPGGREALIRHGETRRAEDELHWIRKTLPRLRIAWACGAVPIVDDMRFLPEFEFVTGLRFARVRMVASPQFRHDRLIERGDDPAIVWSEDPTEKQLDGQKHDFTVRNFPGFDFARRAAHVLDSLRYSPLSDESAFAVFERLAFAA